MEQKTSELHALLKKNEGKKFLLVSHTPLCPDGIASLFAMEKICKNYNIETKKYMIKSAMLPENIAMLNKADLKIDYVENGEIDTGEYDKIVFLDCVPDGSNVPEINKTNFDDAFVIDHHELKSEKGINGGFVDIRHNVGSTSTILAHYLKDLNLLRRDNDGDSILAELLWHGIRTDTEKFKETNSGQLDFLAMLFLKPFCKGKLAEGITERKISRTDWPIFKEVYDESSKKRIEKNGYLFIDAGKVSGIQSLAKAAEYALGNEDVDVSLVIGLNQSGEIVASSRSADAAKSSFDLILALFGKYGGGSWRSAAATYPLKTKIEDVSADTPFMEESDIEEDYKIQIGRIKKVFEEYVEPKKKKIKAEEKSENNQKIKSNSKDKKNIKS